MLFANFSSNETDSNETPLHTPAHIPTTASMQEIVGRYWARMAYQDIGHTIAQKAFLNKRNRLNYANLDTKSEGVYVAKPVRGPQYMGANIIHFTPLSLLVQRLR
ncbi:uncharacterized protein BDW43DRAFT_314151 [Aspergillus alliaceus]|uniref:uncharacterized protein n=1 Tax=Petromyces alliaceus TaxID=209559 RepID=UPI0012A529EF|nr:uncharacterized protein BDW43DRAFT_314151 [Aspergillus alliaceus]KAB8230275.1 hypothetical protein BDW43DRAFT_314151 [Aspergillus alliaceus]